MVPARALAALAAAAAVAGIALPSASAGRDALVGSISAAQLHTPDDTGDLQTFGRGVGASLTWLNLREDAPTGVELTTLFLRGDDGARMYDLGLSVIGSLELREHPVAPFVAVGLDLSSVAVPEPSGRLGTGTAVGVHGFAGLHGFVGESFYWRGQVGYIGAGIGGIAAQLSAGFAFGD